MHASRPCSDRYRDDDELRVFDGLAKRWGRLYGTPARGAVEDTAVRIEAAHATRSGSARGEGDRLPQETRAHDGDTLDRLQAPSPRARRRGHTRGPVGHDLLLEHVEHSGEDGADAPLGQRTRILFDERLDELGLALRIDPALAGRVLVVADGGDELEPAVQELEQLPVEPRDLAPKCLQVAHSLWSSPASTATASRFAGGASGQTQPGSYEQDGL